LEDKVARQFLVNRGFQTREPVDHEDRTTHPLPARNIRRVIRLCEPAFALLTQCDTWTPPLT
jgi:cytochrome oxidase assembly protein ShyY1